MHGVDVAGRVNDHAASRFGAGDGEKPVAQLSVKTLIEPLETVCGVGTSPSPRQTFSDRQIEDQCQVGPKIAQREVLQHRQIRE